MLDDCLRLWLIGSFDSRRPLRFVNRLLIQHTQDGSQRGWRRRAPPWSRSTELRFLNPDSKLTERILLLGCKQRFGSKRVFTRCLPLRILAETAMQQRIKRLGDSDKAAAQPPFFAGRRGGLTAAARFGVAHAGICIRHGFM
jgi:hypothetical protein